MKRNDVSIYTHNDGILEYELYQLNGEKGALYEWGGWSKIVGQKCEYQKALKNKKHYRGCGVKVLDNFNSTIKKKMKNVETFTSLVRSGRGTPSIMVFFFTFSCNKTFLPHPLLKRCGILR